MREIKFRAFYKGKWYYQTLEDCINMDHESHSDNEWGFYKGEYKTQFTGLKDKNGVEIYEGDIVKGKEFGYDGIRIKGWDGYRTGEVVFDKNGMWVYTVNGQTHQQLCYLQKCEVIGNIYEHPHLIPSGSKDKTQEQ